MDEDQNYPHPADVEPECLYVNKNLAQFASESNVIDWLIQQEYAIYPPPLILDWQGDWYRVVWNTEMYDSGDLETVVISELCAYERRHLLSNQID